VKSEGGKAEAKNVLGKAVLEHDNRQTSLSVLILINSTLFHYLQEVQVPDTQ
jgi:hypothetical protein